MALKIKNLLIIIKNGYIKKSKAVRVKNSKIHVTILNQLISAGFIRGFEIVDKNILNIFLKYNFDMVPAMSSFNCLVSVGKRFAVGSFNQSLLLTDFNVLFLNCSSKGFVFSHESNLFPSYGVFIAR